MAVSGQGRLGTRGTKLRRICAPNVYVLVVLINTPKTYGLITPTIYIITTIVYWAALLSDDFFCVWFVMCGLRWQNCWTNNYGISSTTETNRLRDGYDKVTDICIFTRDLSMGAYKVDGIWGLDPHDFFLTYHNIHIVSKFDQNSLFDFCLWYSFPFRNYVYATGPISRRYL